MNLREIANQRLFIQQLTQKRFEQPGEVASWLVALQGQDYAGAKWSLGLRLPGSTEANIERAIAERDIVRTWALRGTLHFLAAADVRWMLALLSGRLIAGSARRNRQLELDEPTLARSSDLLAQAVGGGAQRSRAELFSILEQNGISTTGQRGYHMLHRASLEGLLCQGLTQEKKPIFFALEELPGSAKTLERDEALAELAGRYFTSRGPATLPDFVWWSGLSTLEARAGLEAVRSKLGNETIDDQTYWFSPSEPKPKESLPGIHLLPGFDEYLLAYKDRRASLDVPNYKRLTPTNGMLPATIVSAGRVIGTWKRTFKRDTAVITPSPFEALGSEESEALIVAAKYYGEFLGMRVSVS
jgi:hypothetical protein